MFTKRENKGVSSNLDHRKKYSADEGPDFWLSFFVEALAIS